MSRLDELIAELCPDGVEYRKLGDLCYLITKQTGFDYTNHIKGKLLKSPEEGSVPYIQTKFFSGKNFIYETDYYVPADVVEEFPKITLNEKCLLFSIVGASIGNVGLFPGEKECFLGGAICVAKPYSEQNIDYIYYCVESYHVQNQIRRKTKGAGQATITVEDIRNFTIPFPPPQVQKEIVHILDNYTELTEKLKAELQARKKQYEYYRDSLLTYPKDDMFIEVRLGDIITVERGVRVVRVQLSEDTGYPVYQNSLAPLGYHKASNREGGQTYLIGAGAAGDIGYCNEDFWAADDCYTFVCPETVNNRFLYHCLLNQQSYIYSKVRRSSIPRLSRDELLKLKIKIPPLPIQERVVNVLDKFDAICSDLSSGLPAEIAVRQKQYEYYRDKLLTFKEL